MPQCSGRDPAGGNPIPSCAGNVGAIAFSRTGDPDVGQFEDAVVLKTFGGLSVDPTMLF